MLVRIGNTLALNWGSKFQLLSGIKKQKLNKWVKPLIIEQKNPVNKW